MINVQFHFVITITKCVSLSPTRMSSFHKKGLKELKLEHLLGVVSCMWSYYRYLSNGALVNILHPKISRSLIRIPGEEISLFRHLM